MTRALNHTPLALISLALALSVVGCTPAAQEDAPDSNSKANTGVKEPLKVDATRVEVATIASTSSDLNLALPGEVEGSKEAMLASAIGGFVEKVEVEVGQVVKKGETLARIDARMQRAQARLANVEVVDAKREYDRLVQLEDSVPRASLDAASTRLERARATLAVQQIMVSRATINAPFDGAIASVSIEPGEVAAPGAPLIRLVQLDPIFVTVAVSDRDVVGLTVGDKASVSVGASPELIAGTITRIAPAADTSTRAFEVEVSIANEARTLRPGMIANVRLSQAGATDRMLIPQDFLVTKLEGNGVFVIDENDKAAWRPLELGGVVRDQIVVLSGLKIGDRVVVLGQRNLAEGDALLVAREGQCCTDGRVRWGDEATTIARSDAPARP